MIPKKIHYCWLSGESMPDGFLKCIDSWRTVMPDYEIICWDKSRFDIHSNTFVSEAFEAGKWAFAADYIRLYALYTEGGIYLDADVIIKKKLDVFLNLGFFTSVEYNKKVAQNCNMFRLLKTDGSSRVPYTIKPGIALQAAVMGSVAGHPFLKDCLDFYLNRHFVLSEKKYNDTIIAPFIFAMMAEKYGFRYKDEQQDLANDMHIFPSEIFAGYPSLANDKSYAIHYCAGSWRHIPGIDWKDSLLKKIKQNNLIRKILKKNPLEIKF